MCCRACSVQSVLRLHAGKLSCLLMLMSYRCLLRPCTDTVLCFIKVRSCSQSDTWSILLSSTSCCINQVGPNGQSQRTQLLSERPQKRTSCLKAACTGSKVQRTSLHISHS